MNKKGFTIIELLVVIAIIAVLAAIVMVNVVQYIAKGRDAAIKGNMSTLMTNAAVFFDANPTLHGSDFVGSSYMTNTENQINADKSASYVHNGNTATQDWCECAKETAPATATYFCVDNTGNKREETANACALNAECAATGLCQ